MKHLHGRLLEHYLHSRYGEKEYNLNIKASLHKTDYGMIYPGYKIMVDATVADFYLVDRLTHSKVIGRPTIYLAVDVFSRMLVGLHISMQPESWEGYAIPLHNTFCPKPEYCSRFDISINDEDWPFHHIPVEIIADNSSMRSVDTQVLASEFQIRVEYTKGFTAKLKAVVEHYHSTIKELIRRQMPLYHFQYYAKYAFMKHCSKIATGL